MNEQTRKYAEYLARRREEQGLPLPPSGYNLGDRVVVHQRRLTPEEKEQLSPLMRLAVEMREADEGDAPADKPATFLAYGDVKMGKQLVFVEWEDGGVTLTLEEELEHEARV